MHYYLGEKIEFIFSPIKLNRINAVSCNYINFKFSVHVPFAGNYSDSLSDAKVAVDLLPSFFEAIYRGEELIKSLR